MERSVQRVLRRGVLVVGCGLLVVGGRAAVGRADEVTVKGDVIHGKIKGAKDQTLIVDTGYGKDQVLAIPFENVENIKTDTPMQILHGEDSESIGRILGLQDGRLLVGADPASATAIELATVTEAVSTEGLSWRDNVRSRFRYWDGAFDLGFGLTQSRIDDTSLFVGFSTVRKKAPTRFFLDVHGIYGKQSEDIFVIKPDPDPSQPGREIIDEDTSESRIQDSLKGRVRGEYDLTSRLFAFGSGDAEYDGIQRLSIRAVPKAGLGFKVYETKTSLFTVEAGGAWVYEKFFGGEDNNYFAVAFGSFLETELWYGSKFQWRMDYLPAVDDWIGDYLLRNEASLVIPLFDPFQFKISFIDEYDSTVAEQTFVLADSPTTTRTETRKAADNNKLILAIGLSVAF